MALTHWNSVQHSGIGNRVPTTLFYQLDREMVMNQRGATSFGLLDVVFRKIPVTVFAAQNAKGQVLNLVALPCPPYHHKKIAEAIPGNILL